MFYLVSYDIQDDRSRLKAMKYLKDHGYHFQKSVFVVDCDSRPQATEIYGTVLQMLDQEHDRLLMTPVCSTCWDKVMMAGTTYLSVDEEVWIV